MAEHEMTIHGSGTRAGQHVSLRYGDGHVMIETAVPTTPEYPDPRPGTARQSVVLPLEDFLRGLDTFIGEIARDGALPATLRAEAWRADITTVMTLAKHAAVEDRMDLTDVTDRSDWLLDQVGIGASNWRAAVAEEKVARERGGEGAG